MSAGCRSVSTNGSTATGIPGLSAPPQFSLGGVPAERSPGRSQQGAIAFASLSSSCEPAGVIAIHRAEVELPSAVGCLVMSVSRCSFGAPAVKARSTWPPWTIGPDFWFWYRFREKSGHMPWALHERCMSRSLEALLQEFAGDEPVSERLISLVVYG
jgi:hypothetical protein